MDMSRRSSAFVAVHVVWSTEGRRPVLLRAHDVQLTALLGSVASTQGCTPFAIGCANDHVHVLVKLAPLVRFADLVQRLKGVSAHDVNKEGLFAHRLRWQAGYWAESVGPADMSALIAYIRGQRVHHDDSHPAEVWQRDEV